MKYSQVVIVIGENRIYICFIQVSDTSRGLDSRRKPVLPIEYRKSFTEKQPRHRLE